MIFTLTPVLIAIIATYLLTISSFFIGVSLFSLARGRDEVKGRFTGGSMWVGIATSFIGVMSYIIAMTYL